MAKCYILGAGFGRAAAGIPLMKELVPVFGEVQRKEELAGHKNRARWGKELLEFVTDLEKASLPGRDLLEGARLEECSFRENLEAVASFIDLNLSVSLDALKVSESGKRSHLTWDSPFWRRRNLGEIRRYLESYLYLALIGPWAETELLGKFVDQLNEGDHIITFNYDLLLDSALWRKGVWNPAGGYGIQFKNLEGVRDEGSAVQILKLHGSLNWQLELPRPFPPALVLRLAYDDHEDVFPGFWSEDSRPGFDEYVGGHEPCWMLPSLVKRFQLPEMLSVWRQAQEALIGAEEVVVVGYSLPEADSAASLLLGLGAGGKNLTIVDPAWESLQERYERVIPGAEMRGIDDLERLLSI